MTVALAPRRSPREERIDLILKRMTEGTWRDLNDPPTLAAEWGVTLDTVVGYAREATGRMQTLARADIGILRTELLATVDRYRLMAEEMAEAGDEKALRTALAALDMRAKLLGLYAPTTVHVRPVETLTDEELAAAIEAAARLRGPGSSEGAPP